MTVTINGTTGIAGVDGSAGTPAVQGADTNTGVFFPAADTVGVATGGTERMRVDSSGNVGIATTSPAFKLEVVGGTNNGIHIKDAASATVFGGLFTQASAFALIARSNHALTLGTNDTERMRIDTSGNLLVGTTTNNNSERLMIRSSGSTSATTALRIENSSAAAMFLVRDDGYLRSPTTYNLTGGTANLSIDASGFITRATSSLRYKKDIVNYDKGLAVLNQLRPVYYKSSVAGADGNIPDTQFAGMIAEELDALGLTEFIEYGAENQVEAIRYGNMVSLCIKAIQEQQALITSLTARIEVLEAK